MNSEESKTAYPITCCFCKQEFTMYAHSEDDITGKDIRLFSTCYNKLFPQDPDYWD